MGKPWLQLCQALVQADPTCRLLRPDIKLCSLRRLRHLQLTLDRSAAIAGVAVP